MRWENTVGEEAKIYAQQCISLPGNITPWSQDHPYVGHS
jgi:hypothetical protein